MKTQKINKDDVYNFVTKPYFKRKDNGNFVIKLYTKDTIKFYIHNNKDNYLLLVYDRRNGKITHREKFSERYFFIDSLYRDRKYLNNLIRYMKGGDRN